MESAAAWCNAAFAFATLLFDIVRAFPPPWLPWVDPHLGVLNRLRQQLEDLRNYVLGPANAGVDPGPLQQETLVETLRRLRVDIQQHTALLRETLGEFRQQRTEALGQLVQLRTDALGQLGQLRTDAHGELAQLRTDTQQLAAVAHEARGDLGQLRADALGELRQLRTEAVGELRQLRSEALEELRRPRTDA